MLAERLRGAIAAVEDFIFAPEDARRLAALRIGLFGLLAYRLAVVDYGFVAGQPATLFDPVSLFHLLSAMPSAELTSLIQPLAVIVAVLAAAGALPRATFPLALGLAVFLNLMLNSTGKIVHNDVLLILCLLPLVATPRTAAREWSVGSLHRRRLAQSGSPEPGAAYGWPIRTAMVIVALSYLFVGLQKLRYSGIDWVTSDNLRWVLYGASDGRADPNAVGLLIADRAWLSHLLAAGTVALEVGFIACLPLARLRWIFVPGVVAMHLGIWLMMGLDYSAQLLTVIIVFVNWVTVFEYLRRRQSVGGPVRTLGRRALE